MPSRNDYSSQSPLLLNSGSTTAIAIAIATATVSRSHDVEDEVGRGTQRQSRPPLSHPHQSRSFGPREAGQGVHSSTSVRQQRQQLARAKTSPTPLPRTSSLLPPQSLPQTDRTSRPFPAFNAPPRQLNSVTEPGIGAEAPVSGHPSQTASADTSHDSNRNSNLNRWSVSSASSNASAPNKTDPSHSAVRLSVDGGVNRGHYNKGRNDGTQSSVDRSPRKLQKSRRRSTSNGIGIRITRKYSASEIGHRPLSPPTQIPPLVGLPPISPLFSAGESMQDDIGPLQSTHYTSTTSGDKDSGELLTVESSIPSRGTKVPQRAASVSDRRGSPRAKRPDMPYNQGAEAYLAKGHAQNRSESQRDNADIVGAKGKERQNKPPSQKAMLSSALQRANTAVQLDNAQNFEGARQSYAEACDLLSQVLSRTSTDEDKRKLEAIKQTYISRIDEIDQMGLVKSTRDKALPARPHSLGLRPGPVLQIDDEGDEEMATVETATLTKIFNHEGASFDNLDLGRQDLRQAQASVSQGNASNELSYGKTRQTVKQLPLQSSFSRSPAFNRPLEDPLLLYKSADDEQMPPPLSPRRLESSYRYEDRMSPDAVFRSDFSKPSMRNGRDHGHERTPSQESNSWLDPIDESGGSTASSVHSRTSSFGYRRKQIRPGSGVTEAEFDAALDAAVEAAYNDGYEPMDYSWQEQQPSEPNDPDEDVVAKALRRVQLAKERVRQTEMEALEERQRMKHRQDSNTMAGDFYDDGSSEDEERILEEMTRSLGGDGFTATAAGPIPRESSSSGLTNRTWHSSQGSYPPPTATTLSTVTEILPQASSSKMPEPVAPPPSGALPQPPSQAGALGPENLSPGTAPSVRNRRLSGQNPKQLKIETGKTGAMTEANRGLAPSNLPREAYDGEEAVASGIGTLNAPSHGRHFSTDSQISPTQPNPPTPPLPDSAAPGEAADSQPDSPAAFPSSLRKNYSSSSLRSMRSRNMSVTNLDDASDLSPSTPLSSGYGPNNRLPAISSIATPLNATFGGKAGSLGLHLFDDTFHSTDGPMSPNPLLLDAPAPLEPCPTDYLLRPFWLMRCLYQTLVHPRGGYLSNKLFIPKDVWKTKGVKLRNVEDKISSCDFLTAALLNLAKVDTCDADAMLEEMQSFEGVLEQAQASLTRKLGVEVGVQSSGALFRDATSNSADLEASMDVPRSASVSGKPSAFSWRRLRSKNSGAGLASAYSTRSNGADGGKESPGLETLPMTAQPTTRPTKRDVASAQFTGPNAHYMGSLARLFDAAQTIDQIARQVEDPGLRHADKTQVGLELCTRHAAEFFGFYICRFVLADVGTLVDKFVKRGSEWVMA